MHGLSWELREESRRTWDGILGHPFVIELYRGTLPRQKFVYYVKQDYNYLVNIQRVFSLIAAKAEPDVAKIALEMAHEDATIEMDSYTRLLGKLDRSLEEVAQEEPSPTNMAYMNFLVATAALNDPLEGLVAVLPCFWTYLEIAKRHEEELSGNQDELYVQWARSYLSSDYEDMVDRLRELVDDLYEGRRRWRFSRLFQTASRYELMFWNASYTMEKWPM